MLENDLSLCSRLRFVTHRRRRGGTWGERRSTRRGAGIEFADYRDYTPGDDPRRVDWNLYARLDRPYVRLFEEEEDLAVTVVLDGSGSMGWEAEMETSAARWSMAQRLSAALGAIALLNGDVLRGVLLRGDTIAAAWPRARGRAAVPRWTNWIAELTPGGSSSLGAALKALAQRPFRPGLLLLLTDGYDPAGLRAGITALAGRGHEVALLHLLTPEEIEPELHGDLRLVDVETEDKREITVDGARLAAYRRHFEAWQADLRKLAGQHRGRYALLRTDLTLHRLLLKELRRADILR
ncbi:MAG: DUF58 domain-containing protein [Chloroflexi bacterium]|jgi:uncharacterized protein (DUF58 family)|nr:DUF58 domain-containing protein [Chloroflexota bacterium]